MVLMKVVSLGVHIVDVLGRPVSELPAGQNLALLKEIRMTVAGTAAGAAIDMAKLGIEVIAMGAIGQDEIGEFLVGVMQRYGIDTSHLKRKAGVQTSATMLPIRPNGERPALHVIGANGALTYEDIDLHAIAEASFLHLGGTPLLSRFDGEPASRVLRHARQCGVTTTYDLLGIPNPELAKMVEVCLPYVDYFMPNLEEAKMICGLDDRRDTLRYLLDRGARHVVIKMGAGGSSIGFYDGGSLQEIRTPSFKVPVVDSTGCGDAYNAGLIKGLSLGWDLGKAARLGSACGGLVIQGLGSDAGIIDFEQTMAFAATSETLPLLG
jgi:sugar/nucleoside kinase (ribokinase family)